MRSLQAHLGDGSRVTAVSNLGMDAQGLTPRGTVYSLEQQITHKQALLAQHFAVCGRPVVLLGHSIGTYIAIHAVHRLEADADAGASRAAAAALDSVTAREWEHPHAAGASLDGMAAELAAERRQQVVDAAGSGGGSGGRDGGGGGGSGALRSNIVKIVGLYPFLQVDPDCSRQRRLQRLTPYHALVARLAGGLGYLPLALRRMAVRMGGKDMDAHAVDVTAQVFTDPANVENGLYMGMTEFEALAAPADWWLLRSLGRRLAVFAAPDDIWFKRWKWDAMQREVPEIEAHWVENQSHAFCVSQRQSEELAARIAPIVEAALQASRGTAAAPAGAADSSRLAAVRQLQARKFAARSAGPAADAATASSSSSSSNSQPSWRIEMLYDGDCPLCMREVEMLQRRDAAAGRICFVDIAAPDYDAAQHAGVTFEQAMERIHAVEADGTVIKDVEVFRRLYEEVGLGWVYAVTKNRTVEGLANKVYDVWAKYRLPLTGRPDLAVVLQEKKSCCGGAAGKDGGACEL
ncbi:thiol-disulfide oxidoreductase [Micractinium conductrix]|uniref:Thiol-disulfide oxidoreductase n=1 Tax=Micractinium conductrix TaxID=554055 RepID=A0A2P6VIM8_9CHLO|nr:thiol-disulfide oxidoreductase [Micractinium conductrix]|eukprot:PSC73939.1 thiol-disulfide oxidoreductase [Micractinium conductrix]